MEVDTSQMGLPATPAANKIINGTNNYNNHNSHSNHNNYSQHQNGLHLYEEQSKSKAQSDSVGHISSINGVGHSPPTHLNTGGAKIVKTIRPSGNGIRSSVKLAQPQIPSDTNSFEEFDMANPFKSRPKLGFDSILSESSNCKTFDEINAFKSAKTKTPSRSPSPQSNGNDILKPPKYRLSNENEDSNKNERDISNIVIDNLNNETNSLDEWEAHKKRTPSSQMRKSFNSKVHPRYANQQNQQSNEHNIISSIERNEAELLNQQHQTHSSHSAVSSNTDLSSISSTSPNLAQNRASSSSTNDKIRAISSNLISSSDECVDKENQIGLDGGDEVLTASNEADLNFATSSNQGQTTYAELTNGYSKQIHQHVDIGARYPNISSASDENLLIDLEAEVNKNNPINTNNAINTYESHNENILFDSTFSDGKGMF
jgi:hypothetical protein